MACGERVPRQPAPGVVREFRRALRLYQLDREQTRCAGLRHRRCGREGEFDPASTGIGATTKAPRWAIAYKYPARQATTKLTDIQIQVGRTGALTPVAYLQPALLAGTVVARASLHNEDEIKRLGIKLGDTVLIEKSGEIIPQVLQVVESKRDGSEVEYVFPDKCPV